MTKQTKAQWLAESLERDCQMNWPDYDNQMAAAAELRRLDQHEQAHAEWLSKTEWVQETAKAKELGMHRADVLKKRIDDLTALNAELQKLLAWIIDECHVYPESLDEKAFAQRLMAAIMHPNSAFIPFTKRRLAMKDELVEQLQRRCDERRLLDAKPKEQT